MNTYADYFAGNVVTGDSSRSAKDLSFAIFLVRKGLTPDEVSCILSHTTYNNGKDLKDRYLERTIGKAMEAVQDHSVNNAAQSERPIRADSLSVGLVPLLRYSEIRDVVYPSVERISTGIRHLDLYTTGGLGLKELSLVIAEQGTGKSTLGCWEGAQAQRAGYNVLHVFYEDDIGDLKARYDNHLVGTSSDSDVYFLDGTEKPVTPAQIEEGMKQCQPGLVLIDYLARVPGLQGKADDRFSIRDLMMHFGNLARRYNAHVQILDHVTLVPERLDKYGNPLPVSYVMSMDRLSEAKMYKAMVCGIIIGMMKDKNNKNRVWLSGLKFKRKDTEMKGVSVSVDWSTGRYVS